MLIQRTRLNVIPSGRSRILLYFDESQLEFVENEFVDELLKMKDCVVFYHDSDDALDPDEQPDSIQMIIVLVTESLLNSDAENLSVFLNDAESDDIPVVPLLTEKIQIEDFEKRFGKVQYITWFQESDTKIGFRERLNSMLDLYLVNDDLRDRIISGFRKKIFLSYRKSDRAQAKELIKQIHSSDENCDIAIWFDEMLVAGDEYNMAILDELKDSDVFLLCVTPNVLEKAASGEDNYVKRIEIPSARENDKEIIAVEMVPTEPGWQEELGLEDSECVSFEDVSSVCTDKLGGCSINNMDPEKEYLLGLAYLSGILVEKDFTRGLALLDYAATDEYIPAIREMKDRLFTGNVIPRDYSSSLTMLDSLVEHVEPHNRYYELEVSLQQYYEVGAIEFVFMIIDRMKKLIQEEMEGDYFDKISARIKQGKTLSYLGDAWFKAGDLDNAVYYEQAGCMAIEEFLDDLESADPVSKMMLVVFEKMAKDALAVNYDHLIDYLNRLGRTEEANIVIDKRTTLFDTASDSGANDDFLSYVRRSESFKDEGDFDSAEQCLLKALALFEEEKANSSDWKIKREKAVAFYKLTEVYIMRKKLDEEQIKAASDYLLEAFEIIDEILRYNPQDAEALRDKAICLELAANLYRFQYKIRMMAAMYSESEKLRAFIAKNYPSEIADEDLEHIRNVIGLYGFYPKTFKLSREFEKDEFGDRWAVLYPAENQLSYCQNALPDPDVLPRVPYKAIKLLVKTQLIGEEYNVDISDIKAEILISRGNLNVDVSIILYETVDSEYRAHYVMLFSPEALKAKMIENGLSKSLELKYENGTLNIDKSDMNNFVLSLIKEYFGKTKKSDDIKASSNLFRITSIYQSLIEYPQNKPDVEFNSEGYYLYCVMMDYGRPDFLTGLI